MMRLRSWAGGRAAAARLVGMAAEGLPLQGVLRGVLGRVSWRIWPGALEGLL